MSTNREIHSVYRALILLGIGVFMIGMIRITDEAWSHIKHMERLEAENERLRKLLEQSQWDDGYWRVGEDGQSRWWHCYQTDVIERKKTKADRENPQ